MTKELALATAAALALAGGAWADVIKVGVIAPTSGPYATYGTQFRTGVDTYQAIHGHEVDGDTVEFIWRDSGGVNPDQARSHAQELIIREGVDYLAGFTFTPNALAVAQIIDQSQTPTVIFNAATSIITEESGFFVRPSFTLWQVSAPLAEWAHGQGIEEVVIAVSDYNPGIDAETGFRTAFEAAGGTVLDTIRMPLATTDFAPFMQRVRDAGPDAVFAFLPAGPPTFAFVKAYNDNGLPGAGVQLLGTGETDETTLEALGDAALGVYTAYHYSPDHDSPENEAFLAKLFELHPDAVPNFSTVQAYDGAHVIYEMIRAAGTDGPAAIEAVKGLEWISPRGPVQIDPETRHITQNVYIREVVRDEDGQLVNREFETIEAVPDLGLVNDY
ncbi:amino acid ABC transporter, periplasmic amino-acid binding protein [Oceanicola granulosus HTCC2516]|uniref:Amino acid ABC transporter, periplasmic amino-acid binding protein n=1 Tax=Oceanicola granulosus (strain ATCC BAA-861 / DSM 15982 / KCTC 12143 / HTCC2516) TaxID=314256 RepID=Q2CB35_OCEGH|nr:amino acid ABC transporter, periplasmic amino-acid binding protein [Oceanicola granulosus HTCC2516]